MQCRTPEFASLSQRVKLPGICHDLSEFLTHDLVKVPLCAIEGDFDVLVALLAGHKALSENGSEHSCVNPARFYPG